MRRCNLKKIGLIVIWVASLILVAQWGHTQTAQTPKTAFDVPLGTIISGNDIGFRLDGFSSAGVTGVWMVKLNGAWMPATASTTARPLTLTIK